MQTLKIVWIFLKVGIIAFGGGWSTVGIIKNEVVPDWIDEEGFRSLIAIAQATPGPIALNAATMIGWYHGGWLTAFLTTISVVAFPTLLLTFVLIMANRFTLRSNQLDRMNQVLRIISLSMMLMTLWGLRPTSTDPFLLSYAVLAFILSAFTRINGMWIIFGAGLINMLRQV
jgi:chromate transporter